MVNNADKNRLLEEGGVGHQKLGSSLFDTPRKETSWSEYFLVICSVLFAIITFPFTAARIQRVNQYERGVRFRNGKLKNGGGELPGAYFILDFVEEMRNIDLRTKSFDVPPQQILTRDSLSVGIDAVVYYRVRDPVLAACNVQNYDQSTRYLATTTLRTILSSKTLQELLCDRTNIANDILAHMDEPVRPWGVQIERVELKDVNLPHQLQRAMAAEAEATRDAKAKIIAAKGEQDASHALTEAATVIGQSAGAMQLRYLQTLQSISAEKNSTIVFPLPMDILSALTNNKQS